MPITAAVVKPIVANIEISIGCLLNGHSRPRFCGDKLAPVKTGGGNPWLKWIPGQARNDTKRAGMQDTLYYGLSDSVYARSWDQPLMAGVCIAV
jgi:hypothetical protein